MKVRSLGWAGVEIEHYGQRLVIDALGDPAKVVGGAPAPLPPTVPISERRTAVAGLLTHLHRDHADADALTEALAPGAPVLRPEPAGGYEQENLWLAQAEAELAASGLEMRTVTAWETVQFGVFRATALPAVDAIGDPQIA